MPFSEDPPNSLALKPSQGYAPLPNVCQTGRSCGAARGGGAGGRKQGVRRAKGAATARGDTDSKQLSERAAGRSWSQPEERAGRSERAGVGTQRSSCTLTSQPPNADHLRRPLVAISPAAPHSAQVLHPPSSNLGQTCQLSARHAWETTRRSWSTPTLGISALRHWESEGTQQHHARHDLATTRARARARRPLGVGAAGS